MATLVDQFEGKTYDEKAQNAYDTWSNYAAGRVRAFRELNSKKPIVVTINNFSTLAGIDKTKFAHMIAKEATKDMVSADGEQLPKLGLGVQGATTNDIEKYKKGEKCYADWGKLFKEASKYGVPLQIQTPLHSGVNGRSGPHQKHREVQKHKVNNGKLGVTNTGNMAEIIEFSLSVGANAFELYPYEWLIVNDKQWCCDSPELNWHEKFGKQYSDALTMASNQELAK